MTAGAGRGRARGPVTNRTLLVGASLVVMVAALAVALPALSRTSPFESDFAFATTPLGDPIGPSREHILGVDRLFRDNLIRVAYATRLSLMINASAAFVAVVLGGLVGIIAGYSHDARPPRLPLWGLIPLVSFAFAWGVNWDTARAGLGAVVLTAALWRLSRRVRFLSLGPFVSLDSVLMRLTDTGLALPFMVVMLGIAAAVPRVTAPLIALILGTTGWFGAARIVRGRVLVLRKETFIDAAMSLGGTTPHILGRHVLPNLTGQLVVLFTLLLPQMVMTESALGFLGVGVAPPTATLGQMIYEGRDTVTAYPWILLAPATTLALLVLGLHVLGRGLQDRVRRHEA